MPGSRWSDWSRRLANIGSDSPPEAVRRHVHGFTDREIEPIFALILAHRPLAAIEATPCPRCAASITVNFQPDGSSFSISCAGPSLHYTPEQEIHNPPPWWRERIIESSPSTYYRPQFHAFRADGTLEVRASGWDEESHWTGFMTIDPSSQDYPFWQWLVEQADRYPSILTDELLATIRVDFEQRPR